MAQPTGDEPNFLPDGSLSIHGKRAKKFHVGFRETQNGTFMPDFPNLERSQSETLEKVNEEINKVWNNN